MEQHYGDDEQYDMIPAYLFRRRTTGLCWIEGMSCISHWASFGRFTCTGRFALASERALQGVSGPLEPRTRLPVVDAVAIEYLMHEYTHGVQLSLKEVEARQLHGRCLLEYIYPSVQGCFISSRPRY